MGLTTAITGFSGKTTIAVTDPTGVIQQRVDITFANGTGTMSVNGGAPTAFTAANFLTSLNTALGSAGSASFSASGALSITAANPANGVAIADDPTTPSQNTNGEGFSQFFGLNNLVQASTSTNYNTGLASGSPNTFATGGVISLQLADATGAAIRQASFTIPATATTVGAVIAGLKHRGRGYGSFSLDAKGALTFTAASSSGGHRLGDQRHHGQQRRRAGLHHHVRSGSHQPRRPGLVLFGARGHRRRSQQAGHVRTGPDPAGQRLGGARSRRRTRRPGYRPVGQPADRLRRRRRRQGPEA
ncbi:MAG: hypothetical protein WDN45_12420 [Caulobacteraceae bacterium]